MRVSVVVRSKDEAPRLRLCLAALARQTVLPEVIVVNDGSSDATSAVLDEAADSLPLTIVEHAVPRGRSAASNAGARRASGDVLLFLDGDTLAAPEHVRRHRDAHATGSPVVGRGENFHLRGTRFLLDPESGSPFPGEEARVACLAEVELERMRVTHRQVIEDFASIERRAQPGIYPGAGPRRLYELEMDALSNHPDCSVLWAASSGSNLSVATEDFLRAGGFHEGLENNEHRELALRLCAEGARMVAVDGARTYHLTHRIGWRDPLSEAEWERVFYDAHPIAAVKLLAVFWAGLAAPSPIPAEARIDSLPHLEAAARGDNGIDYDAVRRMIPGLPVLDDRNPSESGRDIAQRSPAAPFA
ncbi:MAG: glycosyltransferase family 2 protein [Betaproteobacteria bacterium]